jgi:hypothetical protein
MKDLRTEAIFQLQDLPVDGGGGDVETLGRGPDGALPCYFVEVAQRSRVQHRLSLMAACDKSSASPCADPGVTMASNK